MYNSNDLLKKMTGQAAKHMVDVTGEENGSAIFRLLLTICGILIIVGAEAVKIVYRKNFGVAGFDIFKLIACVLCLGGVSALAFEQVNSFDNFALESGTNTTHFITGILYALLALYVLVVGIVHAVKAAKDNQHANYNGESNLLGFLLKEWRSEEAIQYGAEPVLTIAIGIFLLGFNKLAGWPIIFCGISVWVNYLIEAFLGGQSSRQTAEKLNQQYNQTEQFIEIK